jgi:chromosome segregation ATPase
MMDFFNGGNLLTLGIIAAAFILFRYLDKGNRNISHARAYGKELKDEIKKELSAFAENKTASLRDYGIILEGDFKRAEVLKKNIEAEIAVLEKNCTMVNGLSERIEKYETVLKQLDSWTEKVEENLRRIEAESAYIELVAEKADTAKKKLNEIDESVGNIQSRVKIEIDQAVNAGYTAIIKPIQAAVDNLKITAEEIGRGVEEHREEINQAEVSRKQKLENDMAVIDNALQKVLAAAAEHSREIEAELLRDLNESAEKKNAELQRMLIEKITSTEQIVDNKINEIEKAVQSAKTTWENENAGILEDQQKYKDEWRQVIIEKLADTEQIVDNKIDEIEKIVQSAKTAWENENAGILEDQQKYKDEWQQSVKDLNALALDQHDERQKALIEKLADTEQIVDNKIDEIEKAVQSAKTAWENENAGILDEQQKYKDEWQQSVKNLNTLALDQRDEWQKLLTEKITNAEQIVDNKIDEIEKAVQSAKTAWKNENAGILDEQQKYKNEWQQSVKDLNSLALDQRDEWQKLLTEKITNAEQIVDNKIDEIEKAVQSAKTAWENENAGILDEQQKYKNEWQQSVKDLNSLALDQRDEWQKLLSGSDALIEQYRRAQISQLAALEDMADDAGKLDIELRTHIENVKNEAANNFAAFETEMKQNYDGAAENLDKSMNSIKNKIDELEKEINGLKSSAYEKVAGNLKEFEELIGDNIEKRTESINGQMIEWRNKLSRRFDELTESIEVECRKTEHECGETLRHKKNELDAHFDEEIKRVKVSFDELGRSISIQTERYEKSIKSLEIQLQNSLEDAKKIVDSTLRTEISRFELQNSERLKKHERGMEEALRAEAILIEERLNEITSQTNKSRDEVEAYKAACAEHFNELDTSIESVRKRCKELTGESEEKLAAIRLKIDETGADIMNQRAEMLNAASEKIKTLEHSISEAGEHIADFFSKTELVDKTIAKTIAVKKDLENKIEDLDTDMEKLALQSLELSELKNQFEKIKRMEEDLNNKMTQFSIEQQRIERMEINFNRLLQTSQSVEERLKHITGADDMLQEAQIKIRKLGEAMAESEEKYLRIEKKNQILEAANDGIEKNFKSLQESENLTQKLNGDIQRISSSIEDIRHGIEFLSTENEKAHDTVEQLSNLDQTILDIDARIQNVQKARVWLADLETRLDEKYREVRQQLKLTDNIIKKQDGKLDIDKESSLSLGTRDDVIRLKKQGWTVDEIVKNMKISRAAVELILETTSHEK